MEEYTAKRLQEIIGYHFFDEGLLRQALTHSSYANERKINRCGDYERLEFLGDAVLELVTSEFLYRTYPQMPEGRLTKLRASMVCEPALAYCAKDLELGKYLFLGKGEAATGGRDRASITSDVMEAIIGAIFLDSGMEQAKYFIMRFILNDIEDKQLFYDSKTILQEQVQKTPGSALTYELISEEGPEHEKTFTVHALIDGRVMACGSGRSKKAAEQEAAYHVLLDMKKEGKVTIECI